MASGAEGRKRIGLFGGTFDPPHVGHVTVARDVANQMHLDEVVWIPAALPPHKQELRLTPGPVRMRMVREACREDSRFDAWDVELARGGISYTVDTIRAAGVRWPGADLVLILGVDQFRTMATDWREAPTVVALATLAVMDRHGDSARRAIPDVPGAERAVFVPVTRVDVSSTEVRAAVAAGADTAGRLPAGVMAIVRREALYRG